MVRRRHNPLELTALQWILGAVALAGAGAAVYVATKPATKPVLPPAPAPGGTNATHGGGPAPAPSPSPLPPKIQPIPTPIPTPITLPTPGPAPTPPTVMPTPGGSLSADTYTVTEASSGVTVSMNVGDTLAVVLDLGAATNFDINSTGNVLAEGTYDTATLGQISQSWTATSSGTGSVMYQPLNAVGANIGSPYIFNINVS